MLKLIEHKEIPVAAAQNFRLIRRRKRPPRGGHSSTDDWSVGGTLSAGCDSGHREMFSAGLDTGLSPASEFD